MLHHSVYIFVKCGDPALIYAPYSVILSEVYVFSVVWILVICRIRCFSVVPVLMEHLSGEAFVILMLYEYGFIKAVFQIWEKQLKIFRIIRALLRICIELSVILDSCRA